jgi:hypothetical protein
VARGLVHSSGTSNFFRGQGAIGTSERKSYNTGQYTPIAVHFVAARKSGALGLQARSMAEADTQGADLGNGVYVKSWIKPTRRVIQRLKAENAYALDENTDIKHKGSLLCDRIH